MVEVEYEDEEDNVCKDKPMVEKDGNVSGGSEGRQRSPQCFTRESSCTDDAIGQWRRLLGMEDGQPLEPDNVLSNSQRAHIEDTYRNLQGPERTLFLLGFNGYMASLSMELTLCVKEVEDDNRPEYGEDPEDEDEAGNGTAVAVTEGDREGAGTDHEDDANLVQTGLFNKDLLRPSQRATDAGKFGLLLEPFVVERLQEFKKAAVAARMLRQLRQRCEGDTQGVMVDGNAQALQAALVVFSDGPQDRLTSSEEAWMEYWWTVMNDHLQPENTGGAASSVGPNPNVIHVDSQGEGQPTLSATPPTQMVGTGMWDPSQLGADTLKWIDEAIKAEEEMRQDTLVDSVEEAARKESEEEERAFQEYVNGTAEWLAEQRAEEMELLRRTKAEAEAREAADRRMAEWLDRQEQAEAAAKEEKKRREAAEVRSLNAAFEAARYRNWESWVVLHEPRSGGGPTRAKGLDSSSTPGTSWTRRSRTWTTRCVLLHAWEGLEDMT